MRVARGAPHACRSGQNPRHCIQVSLDVRTGVRPETQRLPQGHPDGHGVMPLQRL